MDRARDRFCVIECDILADRLPWLGDSKNSFAIVEAHFIQSLHDVLEPTNAGDQTRGREPGFQKFCERVNAMPHESLRGGWLAIHCR